MATRLPDAPASLADVRASHERMRVCLTTAAHMAAGDVRDLIVAAIGELSEATVLLKELTDRPAPKPWTPLQ